MKLENPDDRITVSEAAKLTGLSRQQLRRLWTRGSLTPPIVSLHDGRERLLLRQEIEEVLPKDDDHLFTVTLAEFAQRLGLSTQTVRARYRDHGRLIQGRLCFREDFVISMLAHTWGGPPQEFTVSTLDAARQIGCHVNTLSRRLKRKGLRKGRTVYFRQSDVDREEWRFRRDQLVDEFEVMRLLGAKHPVQVYFLTAKTACHPVLYMWNRDWGFPKWYGLVARMPAPLIALALALGLSLRIPDLPSLSAEQGLKEAKLADISGLAFGTVRSTLTRPDGGNVKTLEKVAHALGEPVVLVV